MGIFDFLKNIGRDAEGDTAQDIKQTIEKNLAGQFDNLDVSFDDGTVTLQGKAKSRAAREKAILLAGNVKGVEKVDDDKLRAAWPKASDLPQQKEAEPEPRFHTVEKGDSLSKIAKSVYGDAQQWRALFEANREVIEDPDLIYPGQKIRIPELR